MKKDAILFISVGDSPSWPKATVFEIVIISSNLITPANLYRVRIVENTQSYEVWNGGSIPSRDTSFVRVSARESHAIKVSSNY